MMVSSIRLKMLLNVFFVINWRERVGRKRPVPKYPPEPLAHAYLGLDGLFLAHQLRPQDEDFLLADIELLTHRGQLLHEDTVGWCTWSGHLGGTFLTKGLA